MIIDTHAHLAANPKGLDEVAEGGVIEQVWLLEIRHDGRQDPNFEWASTSEMLEVSRRYPGFFIPFGFIDFMSGPEQVDRMRDAGFPALKAIRPPEPYDAPAYFPIYERADALGMPILFHVGIIAHRLPAELRHLEPPGPTTMRPSMLDGIAAAFPKLKLIQGHMGVPWTNELFESLYYYDQMYCSVCGLVDYKWLIENLDRSCANRENFCDRMMFAVDTLYGMEGTAESVRKRAAFMDMFFDNVGRTYRWGADKAKFLRENAIKFAF